MHRIVDITVTPLVYDMPAARAYGNARGLTSRRAAFLVQVVTDDGVVGIGETFGLAPAATLGYLETIKPFYIGQDLFSHPFIWNRIVGAIYHLRVQNQMTALAGGINIAIYDAMGKLLGLPVHKLLGGAERDRVPVYASGGYISENPKGQLEHQLEAAVRHPHAAYKIKIGTGPQADAARCRLARDIIGEGPLLMVDVNGNYTADTAAESMARITDSGIHWYEEPLPPEDFAGLARLATMRRHGGDTMRIATGEAHFTAHEYKRLLDTGAVDVLMPDLNLCGGFTEGKNAALLTTLYGARISPHVWGSGIGLAAAVHFVASLPPTPHTRHVPFPAMVEYDVGENALRDGVLAEPLTLVDGTLPVPQGPGLGITLDPDAVRRYTLR
jgi:D-galactarolactone cycloisomerase